MYLIGEEEYRKIIIKHYNYTRFLALASFLVPFFSFIDIYSYFNDTSNVWFQRSGSIMVVLAAFSEMYAFKMQELLTPHRELALVDIEVLQSQYLSRANKLKIISAILIAIGTLIWGYGDLTGI